MWPLFPWMALIDDEEEDQKDFEYYFGNIPELPELPVGKENVIPESLQKDWLEKGLCPKCGLKGRVSHFSLFCDKCKAPY